MFPVLSVVNRLTEDCHSEAIAEESRFITQWKNEILHSATLRSE